MSEEDINAIKSGYASRSDVIEKALLRELSDEESDYYTMGRLNLLANLIADNILDIRIAFTEDKSGIGMYHEKMGLIEDADGNVVAFSGSMNESATAMSINYETIDVYRSWFDENELERVKGKQNAFHAIWNDSEPNIRVLEFPSISQAIIDKYKRSAPNFDIDHDQFAKHPCSGKSADSISITTKPIGARVPSDIKLHPYQEDAISKWVGENYRGIFDMATGTGKTYTGLGAISKISEDLNDELAVFIVCPYQHLVDQWVEDIVRFNIEPIIGYSSSPQKDWKKRLSTAVRNQKLRSDTLLKQSLLDCTFCDSQIAATDVKKMYSEYVSSGHKDVPLSDFLSRLVDVSTFDGNVLYALNAGDEVLFFGTYEQLEVYFEKQHASAVTPWETYTDEELAHWLERIETEFKSIPLASFDE